MEHWVCAVAHFKRRWLERVGYHIDDQGIASLIDTKENGYLRIYRGPRCKPRGRSFKIYAIDVGDREFALVWSSKLYCFVTVLEL